MWFAAMRHALEELNASERAGYPVDGMSGDFEAAILEGATIVRVGTALFGERPRRTDAAPPQ